MSFTILDRDDVREIAETVFRDTLKDLSLSWEYSEDGIEVTLSHGPSWNKSTITSTVIPMPKEES